MSTTIACPICQSIHDVSTRITGDIIICRCSAPLLVQHDHRVTQLRPDVQHTIWHWLEAEIAALWMEIYRNRTDLEDGERYVEADRLYAAPPELLIETLAYARDWDAAVAEQRRAVRAQRIEEAAWALREADLWPEAVALVGGEPSEFDTAIQRLYAVLQNGGKG